MKARVLREETDSFTFVLNPVSGKPSYAFDKKIFTRSFLLQVAARSIDK